jgi:small subunit ribosomal protein S2
MPVNVTMNELIEAGAHYGHQARRWNPNMRPYIFGERNGIHIIDLQKTVRSFKKACEFIEHLTSKGGHVLFVGTKRQARDTVAEHAQRCGMYYVNFRWLGGTLTNYNTMRQSVSRLRRLEKMSADGTLNKLVKKEALNLERQREKLERNLGGIKDMPGLPKAIFITDAHKEHIAIKEAKKLKIPIVAITDTNCDPTGIDYIIPGNDDSLKSLQIFIKAIADACAEGVSRRKNFSDEKPSFETQEGTIFDREGHSVKVVKKKLA